MKKYCPFCDSELSETLWCEHCRRYAILYNTHAAAARDTREDSEAEKRELYRRLTAAIKNLHAVRSAAAAAEQKHLYTPAAGEISPGENSSPKTGSRSAASKPAMPAMPEDPGKNPGRDTPKLILLSSMLLVCFVLCLVVCAYLVLNRGVEPSGTARAVRSDTQDEYLTESAPRSTEKPAEMISSEPPAQSADEALEQTSTETPAQSADEALEQASTETPAQSADEALEQASTETPAQSADEASADAGIPDWKQLEQLAPLDLQVYGDTKYYYYAAEDIESLGIQCTYYHLELTYDDAVDAVKSFFGDAAAEEEPYDNTYFNSYVDNGYEYYTSFQQILSYDCGELKCSVNYDTGSGIVHFVSFSGAAIEDCAGLIQEISTLASPEYALSPEALLESILSVKDILSHMDPPDMWHEEYVYQDSCISLSMTYSDGVYELQATSRKYADDTVQNTLSISRPK